MGPLRRAAPVGYNLQPQPHIDRKEPYSSQPTDFLLGHKVRLTQLRLNTTSGSLTHKLDECLMPMFIMAFIKGKLNYFIEWRAWTGGGGDGAGRFNTITGVCE